MNLLTDRTVAANIAIDVLKMESEGIKAVKQGRGLMAEAKQQQRQQEHCQLKVTDSDMMEELEKSC